MIFFLLFIEFARIGLFSFGGGYAAVPFLYHMSEVHHWFSHFELTQMLSISSITPGPIGLNMATFAGFKTAGVLGSIVATSSLVLPSFFFVILVSKVLKKFQDNIYAKSILYTLRPASVALISGVAFKMFFETILKVQGFHFAPDYKAFAIFALLALISLKVKRDPLIYLLLGAVLGVVVS